MTAPVLDPNEETHLLWTPLPTEPRAIGEALARLQAEQDAELRAITAKYRARFAELHAQWIRARQALRNVA